MYISRLKTVKAPQPAKTMFSQMKDKGKENTSNAVFFAFIGATILAFVILVSPYQVSAQEKSADEVARELSNPNTALASLTFKNQFRWFEGDLPNADDQSSYTMLFQPALPFPLENGDKIIWRPAVALIVDQPVFDPGKLDFDEETGLGDIGFDLVYATTTETGLLMAAGIFTTLPTATSNALGSGQWSIGPEILIGKLDKKYVLGILPNHQWNVTG